MLHQEMLHGPIQTLGRRSLWTHGQETPALEHDRRRVVKTKLINIDRKLRIEEPLGIQVNLSEGNMMFPHGFNKPSRFEFTPLTVILSNIVAGQSCLQNH